MQCPQRLLMLHSLRRQGSSFCLEYYLHVRGQMKHLSVTDLKAKLNPSDLSVPSLAFQ